MTQYMNWKSELSIVAGDSDGIVQWTGQIDFVLESCLMCGFRRNVVGNASVSAAAMAHLKFGSRAHTKGKRPKIKKIDNICCSILNSWRYRCLFFFFFFFRRIMVPPAALGAKNALMLTKSK